MIRLGVVTGMATEARCLPRSEAGDAVQVVCSGGDSGRAAAGAKGLLARGANGLLSFGLAGGIDPALAAGAVVIGDTVIASDGRRWEVGRSWRDALVTALAGLGPVVGAIAGSDRPLATVAGKRALYAATGALAVDMESHAIARVAAENGIPFVTLRVVADPAKRALPRSALAGLGADGQIRTGAVLWRLALRPWEAPRIVALALDTRRALAALRRCSAAADALLGGGSV
ncbi:MAG: hypothetical protein ACE5LF_00755 [Alphaproteobacteria bacterium]